MQTDLQFVDRLHRLLALRGLSIGEFAAACHVTFSTASRWRRGLTYPRVPELKRLCAVLQTSSDYMLGLDIVK